MNLKIFIVFLSILLSLSPAFAGEQGVYVKVAEKVKGSFDEVSGKVETALKASGWEVLAAYNTGVPEGCKFRSRVIVFSSPAYAKFIMSSGVKSAFALPLRAGIYEDETGINIAVVNPASINKTIINKTKLLEDFSTATINSIVDAIAKTVSGSIVKKQIGEIRSKGRVGGMGGGDFLNKIEEIYVASASPDTFKKVSELVKNGISGNKKNWKLIYTLDLSAHNSVIFGITETKMEGKAFKIAGEKRSSDSYRFPGIDHNAAFPIEVIVYKDGDKIKVVALNEMYRMKVYFEDAGKWAFMKNMAMPGQIEDEIFEIVKTHLK